MNVLQVLSELNTDINQFSILYTSLTKTFTSTSLPRTNNTLYAENYKYSLQVVLIIMIRD